MAKVLLIEDDKTMLSLLRTLLRFEGFEIAQLQNDESLEVIMEAIRNEAPDLVLLDVNLRQVNGFDLLRLIRQSEELKSTRVLMSSGIDFRDRCRKEGANGFILKPYMPEDLIEKIQQTLEN